MRLDPNLLAVFLTIAERGGLAAAARHLDVSRSAVSQSLRRLEDQLGTALLLRTTRSVGLTEAGRELCDRLKGPFADINAAVEQISDKAGHRGHLKLAVTPIAERLLYGTIIADFAVAHPGISIDVTVTDSDDLVADGFDAGVRLGEVLQQDMIAVPIGPEIRQMAVATPGYLAAHGTPDHPGALTRFRCIGWRPAPDAAPYRWEFCENGHPFSVQVNPQLTSNDPRFLLQAALAGAGIAFATEETFAVHVASGALVQILADYLAPFPGFYLYYPDRRNMAPKLRAFADYVREARRDTSKKRW